MCEPAARDVDSHIAESLLSWPERQAAPARLDDNHSVIIRKPDGEAFEISVRSVGKKHAPRPNVRAREVQPTEGEPFQMWMEGHGRMVLEIE